MRSREAAEERLQGLQRVSDASASDFAASLRAMSSMTPKGDPKRWVGP